MDTGERMNKHGILIMSKSYSEYLKEIYDAIEKRRIYKENL